MDKYESFKECVALAAERFKEIEKKEAIRLVSHLDADGISACSILIKMLNSNNRKYSISIVPQLTKEIVIELSKEPYNYFIFSDLGSGQLEDIRRHLPDKTIFIFDHHKPRDIKVSRNIIHVNPHLFGIDGSKEISGAGVIYLFAEQLNKGIKDMAHIAVIGAIGDIQEDNGFLNLNNEILETAIKRGRIKVIRGLRIFGAQTKPLHKVLEYCTDPYIPGVSGSESGAIHFLNQIGISPRDDNGWKKIVNLKKEELKTLVAGVIMKRFNEKSPEDVLGNVYILRDERKESPLRDAKEFATLLNACGRMGKASLGIGTCLGDRRIKVRALRNMDDYKKQIVSAMRWYEDNKESKDVIVKDDYIIINAKENIMPTIIGTVASILSKSNGMKDGTFIMSMARQVVEGTTKASLRISCRKNKDIDLREIVRVIAEHVGGEAGGHQFAAGAIIQTDNEKEFIEKAKEILSKRAIEEIVR